MSKTKIASFNLSRLVRTDERWFIKREKSRDYTALSAVIFREAHLDVVDSSLKNYAPVHQCPFNGADSQRWQLLSC